GVAWLWVGGLWTAFAAFNLFKRWVMASGKPNPQPVLLPLATIVFFATWALVTPLLVRAVRARPLRRPFLVRNTLRLLPTALLAMVLPALAMTLVHLATDPDGSVSFRPIDIVFLLYDGPFLVGFIVCTVQHLDTRAENARRRRDAAALKAEVARVQLQRLRADLDPHFLFNTLNAVAALIGRQPERGEAVLAAVTELLGRSVDWRERTEVPLAEEVRFVERYLDIQKMRFGIRLRTRVAIAPDVMGVPVPPLILQPLVENAIVHGIGSLPLGGELELTARAADGCLRIEVRDTGEGLPAHADVAPGLGIANIRARLQLLYGAEHSLAFRRDGDYFVASLTVPIRALAGAA
ncbi:MAG TPA: histidine kinase, partial [Thermoanaerobaculia bacterium]|nr:histidine kinase [Thermoanaerobaculia bacterium]